MTIPKPVVVGVILLLCVGLIAGAWILGGPMIVLAIIGCLIVTVVILGVFALFLAMRQRKKAAAIEHDIRESGGAVPQGIHDVADRARLDEMRTKFEQGVRVFREKGKDLYSLPWYVIIGEPGSGKTEAIRHCGIGFPPGLQDELQGTGGTINMDWWFTNNAVILDTAGRLTFGDVDSVDTREWSSFLNLLRKHRPNCPINGLLVAIPVDSLIQDDVDMIERKGGRIARQLDRIQQALGVRFPVFIVVTKADKLLGFRQFFHNLRDPDLQGQMVGWSNPDPLDEPFDPAEVEDALALVQDRLIRRGLGLLVDPIHSEDPSKNRIEEVDELYAFPEAMERITGRLRRYLEMIFVAGEWSSKPLFLRGIYFTSSMQHGAALDEELAEAMGVDVESLQDAAWTEDRAYFLRDVFLEKVFREHGLVSRATNTRAQAKKRKTLVLVAGLITITLMSAAVWSAWSGYQGAIGDQSGFWEGAAKRYEQDAAIGDWSIVAAAEGQYFYRGRATSGGDTMVELLEEARTNTERDFDTPWLFDVLGVMTSGDTDFGTERKAACRKLVEEAVIGPLVTATAVRLEAMEGDWTPAATGALVQLVDIDAFSADPRPRPDDLDRPFDVEKLFRFLLPEESNADALADAPRLQAIVDWLYGEDQMETAWPPAIARRAVDREVLRPILSRFHDQWTEGVAPSAEVAAQREALASFARAETEFRAIRCAKDASASGVLAARDEWNGATGIPSRYDALATAKTALDERLQIASGRRAFSIESELNASLESSRADAKQAYDALYAAALRVATADIDAPPAAPVAGALDALREKAAEGAGAASDELDELDPTKRPETRSWIVADLEGRWNQLVEQGSQFVEGDQLEALQRFDAELLPLVGAGTPEAAYLYEARFTMYAAADELVRDLEPNSQGLLTDLKLLESGFARTREKIQAVKVPRGDAATDFTLAREFALCAAEHLGRRTRETAIMNAALREFDGSIAEVVKAKAEAGDDPRLAKAQVPLTRSKDAGFDPSYHPVVAPALIENWKALCERVEEDATRYPAALKEAVTRFKPRVNEYLRDYLEYWTETVPETEVRVAPRFESWSAFREALSKSIFGEYTEPLEELENRSDEGLDPLAGADGTCIDLDDGDVRDGRKRLEELLDGAAGDDAEARFRNWRNLDGDALEARRQLVAALNGKVLEDRYLAKDGFWYEFYLSGLTLMATDVEARALGSVALLKQVSRFPLKPEFPPLTMDEVTQARGLISIVQVEGASGSPDAPTEALNRVLRRIMQPDVDVQPDELARIATFLAALPEPRAKPFTMEITVLAPPAGIRAAKNFWQNAAVSQNGNPQPKRIRDAPRVSLGTVEYPGGPIEFTFYANDALDQSVRVAARRSLGRDGVPSFADPWGALLLLYDLNAEPQDGGRTWRATMRLKDRTGQESELPLELKLSRPVPPAMIDPSAGP